MAPDSNDSLPDFPEDHDWNPSRGPRGHLIRPIHLSAIVATTNAQSALLHDLPKDTDMLDPEATTADTQSVASQSTAG